MIDQFRTVREGAWWMLRFSTRTRYGVRAIFDIAYNGGTSGVQIKDISRRQEISPRYLEQIFHKLKKAGIVQSKRGPAGGYRLAKKAKDLTVGEIARVTEGSIEPVRCIDPDKPGGNCNRLDNCVTRLMWEEAGKRLKDYLDSVTIQDLCDKAREMGVERDSVEGLMYYI
jgi:Rrf2 family protein